MQLEVYNIKGEPTGRTVELPDEVFGITPHEHSVWLDVKRYLAAQRQGTHKSKERSEMSGSTRKLHRQKGTGGSRKGDINNPLFRGGGRIFGPRPRNYEIQVNAKEKKLARRSALAAKAQAGSIIVVEDFRFEAPQTKAFRQILEALKVADQKTLTILGGYDQVLYKSCRNLPKAAISPAKDVNTYQIVNSGVIVLAESAIEKIKEACA